MDNRSMKADISTRILETRKQTEELKAQLQNLIDSGINSSLEYNKCSDQSNRDKENLKEPQNKVQIIKSYDPKYSQHVNKAARSKIASSCKQKDKTLEQGTNKESPKKVRSYDVKEAQDYIKKQRQKRLEQLKSQNNEKIKAELQKKKLQELHKKSLELVTKNVQANRERSKSRDRKGFVRPDQDTRTRTRSYSRERNYTKSSNDIKCDIKRAKSVDRVKNVHPAPKKNPNLLYPPLPDYIVKLSNKSPEKQINIEDTNSNMQVDSSKSPQSQLNGDQLSKTLKPKKLFDKTESKHETEESVKVCNNENFVSVTNILDYANSAKSNNVRSPKQSNLKPPDIMLSESVRLKDQQSENHKPENKPKSKLSEVAIGTDNLEKDTKETQTGREQRIEFPLWLQEKPTAYPFNFINSVRRKLHDAVNSSKQLVDVAVQNSSIEEKQNTPKKTKTKEAIMEMLQNSTKSSRKSDLKSFISHKCLNLDPKAIDHLELIPKRTSNRNETITKVTVSGSESDTSKNIPEISSESLSKSLKKGSGLNVEKLSKLKLVAHNVKIGTGHAQLAVDEVNSMLNTSKSRNKQSSDKITNHDTENSNIHTVNIYTNDFQSESDVSKSRESIISFNSATQNKQTVYNRSPEYDKTRSKHTNSSYIPEIVSPMHSKDIPELISKVSGDFERNSLENAKKSRSYEQNGLNVERLSKLQLNTHGYKDNVEHSEEDQIDSKMKTSDRRKLKSGGVKRNTETEEQNLLVINSDYTSEFGSDLSRSRESIISFNSPTYNKQTIYNISPQYDRTTTYIPDTISSKHSKDIPETVSINTNVNLTNRTTNTTSKESLLTKNSSGISTKSKTTTSSKPRSGTNRKEKENKSSSNLLTETETHKSKKSQSGCETSQRSETYTALCSEPRSSPTNNALFKSDSSVLNINTQRGCNDFSKSDKLTEVLPLKEPTISLTVTNKEIKGKSEEKTDRSMLMKNISLRSAKNLDPGDLSTTNEIHLKFEAEIHLLNDFNESLRQFSAVEKAFESLKSKNDNTATVNKILQNRDTQTSILTKSPTSTRVTERVNTPDRTRSEISTVNYSRGSFVNEDSSSIHFNDTISKLDDKSLISTGAEVSNLNKSSSSVMKSAPDLSNFENLQCSNFADMTLKMFEQLIKDEDVRLENLKTILKIREQALLDRTKGELAWLEIQRKHLRETGKLQEASLIKKKQRGILVNHQKEKHEMQRLKQMQKAASIERKIILKEQRNLIKHRLATDAMISKMKVHTPRERRLSGPLKVIQSHSESIRSETSISKRSSSDKDVYSITSHTHSIVSKVSEISGEEMAPRDIASDTDPVILAGKLTGDGAMPVTQMKKTLLMREVALQKRRKAAEELLQWHKKLLEEERRITELESTANAIISHAPSNATTKPNAVDKYKFRGRQLNQLWFNLTGCEEKKFTDDKVYPMSQISLERFCKSAREYSTKTKKLLRKASDSEVNSEYSEPRTNDSVSEKIPENRDISGDVTARSHKKSSGNDYASDFEVESIQDIISNKDMDTVDHNLNQLIDNFNKIEADISSLGIKRSLKTNKDHSDDSPRSENTSSDIEVSVIETTKTSREEKAESGKSQLDSSIEKLNIANKNLSIIEEINKSTRDTLSKSEEVLLKLSQAEDNSKESVLIEDIEPPSEITFNLRRINSLEDKTRSGVSEIPSDIIKSSSKNSSSEENQEIIEDNVPQSGTVDETTYTLNRAREILERLSQAGNSVRTASSRKKSPIEDNLASNRTLDNLSKTEEILDRLSLTEAGINSELSSNRKSIIEEDRLASEAIDNLNKTEEILENLSRLGSNIGLDNSGEESLSIEDEIVTRDSGFNKASQEEEIKTGGSSKGEAAITEENQESVEGDVCLKSSQEEEKISSVVNKDTSGEKSSVIEENGSTRLTVDLTEDEEPLMRLSQSLDKEQLEEGVTSELAKSDEPEEQAAVDNSEIEESHGIEDKISTVASGVGKLSATVAEDHIQTSKALTSGTSSVQGFPCEENQISGKDLTVLVSKIDENGTESKKAEEISESLKETFADEDLSSVDEPKLDGSSKMEALGEIIEIQDDTDSVIVIEDDEETEDVDIKTDDEENTAKTESAKLLEDLDATGAVVEDNSFEEEFSDEEISPGDISVELKGLDAKKNESESIPTKTSSKDENKSSDLEVPTDVDNSNKSHATASPRSKEEINTFEEKEQDSLSLSASSGSQPGVVSENDEKSGSEDRSGVSEGKSVGSGTLDVKKRVSEIMADASQSPRGDRSPRLQDLYVTTYDLVSPANSPELGSPIEEQQIYTAKSIFGTEAEEILRKQLAIEQEIKLITEQQQKEHIPYMYVREIPNKPPPPYTPPSSLPPLNVITIIPTTQEIEEITKYSAKILHKAYLSNGLDNISISENTLGLISKSITKECYKFVFDICKEITKEHYKQFEKERCVSWLKMRKKPQLADVKPLDVNGLERHLNKHLKELFGYEKPNRRENAIIKWSRKKRDYVDEILVMESQAEEGQWINYEKDELLVMNEVTNEIMNMLLKETGDVFNKILSKLT